MTYPFTTLPASIRATQDIWTDEDNGQLYPAAAMRLWDHHLHTSGLLPRAFVGGEIYEHDWHCTYTSISCFPHEALIELILEDGSNTETHVWVDRVGPSTLYLSQMVTLYDEVLATSVRTFTRKIKGVPVPFNEEERYHFETKCAATQSILDFQVTVAEKYPGDEDPPSPSKSNVSSRGKAYPMNISDESSEPEKENEDVNNTSADTSVGQATSSPRYGSPSSRVRGTPLRKRIIDQKHPKRRKMTLSSTLCLESFGTFLPQFHGSFLLAIRVGPQHLDSITNRGSVGKIADAAWLADVAFQALYSAELLEGPASAAAAAAGGPTPTCCHTHMAVSYRSVAMLGNELRCFLHGDRVIMIRSSIPAMGERKGNQTVVLIAKAGPVVAVPGN